MQQRFNDDRVNSQLSQFALLGQVLPITEFHPMTSSVVTVSSWPCLKTRATACFQSFSHHHGSQMMTSSNAGRFFFLKPGRTGLPFCGPPRPGGGPPPPYATAADMLKPLKAYHVSSQLHLNNQESVRNNHHQNKVRRVAPCCVWTKLLEGTELPRRIPVWISFKMRFPR